MVHGEDASPESLVEFMLAKPEEFDKRVALLKTLAKTGKPIRDGVYVTVGDVEAAVKFAESRLGRQPSGPPIPVPRSQPTAVPQGAVNGGYGSRTVHAEASGGFKDGKQAGYTNGSDANGGKGAWDQTTAWWSSHADGGSNAWTGADNSWTPNGTSWTEGSAAQDAWWKRDDDPLWDSDPWKGGQQRHEHRQEGRREFRQDTRQDSWQASRQEPRQELPQEFLREARHEETSESARTATSRPAGQKLAPAAQRLLGAAQKGLAASAAKAAMPTATGSSRNGAGFSASQRRALGSWPIASASGTEEPSRFDEEVLAKTLAFLQQSKDPEKTKAMLRNPQAGLGQDVAAEVIRRFELLRLQEHQ
eukprot:TRINITY_DN29286_c0_g1_i1.p1 TRINITY_DN29286_c0_g1~~TRINITY_DN29286_c0_g1_i1.p1  ORF type:complete len:385 (+),score=46.61 TRINITY_DN29286_c0_g1_i1:72-1157(+)